MISLARRTDRIRPWQMAETPACIRVKSRHARWISNEPFRKPKAADDEISGEHVRQVDNNKYYQQGCSP
ncbi:MAG: hypothetical protein ACP5OU_05715 [Methanothrix sp.]